jgi:hypothetical protein
LNIAFGFFQKMFNETDIAKISPEMSLLSDSILNLSNTVSKNIIGCIVCTNFTPHFYFTKSRLRYQWLRGGFSQRWSCTLLNIFKTYESFIVDLWYKKKTVCVVGIGAATALFLLLEPEPDQNLCIYEYLNIYATGKESEPSWILIWSRMKNDAALQKAPFAEKNMYTRLITAELILLLRCAPALVSGRFNFL